MHVYLHIGFPKTGSTAIQSHIFTNQAWLQEQGFLVPQAGYRSGLGHAFLFPLTSGYASPSAIPAGDSKLEDLASEIQEAESKGYRKAILSWEGFARLPAEQLSALRSALADHVVTVIAYVREQAALYQSAVIQEIESLKSLSNTVLFKREGLDAITPDHLDFNLALEQWAELLDGEDRIETRVYDRDLLKDGNVVIDFLDCLDIKPDANFCLQTRNVNHSLDTTAAGILLLARKAGLPHQGLQRLARALTKVAGSRPKGSSEFLSPQEISHITDHYMQGNASYFTNFTPSNVDSGTTSFGATGAPAREAQGAIPLDYLRAVHAALESPNLEIWQGAALAGKRLASIAGAPNAGWRGPEEDGVWSVGKKSEISFLLPDTHPTAGPSHVLLRFAGHYFEGNNTTRVRARGVDEQIGLDQAVLEIPLHDIERENGIHLELEHSKPQVPGREGEVDLERGLAYKLQYLSYSFRWQARQ